MSTRSTRRDFLKQVAVVAGATPLFLSRRAKAQENKFADLRIAFIATGGIAGAHIGEMVRLGVQCPCYCDIDENAWGNAANNWPNARAYVDYRELLEKEAKNIDGVMIGTPDHHHYPPSILAMEAGLHCYTQKPLTHTPWEARRLARAAADHPHLATQMGNQGHASDAWRHLYNFIHADGIGTVKEVHTWTDRALGWWPQGMVRPAGSDPVPGHLHWDEWLGPAPAHPYLGSWPEDGAGYKDRGPRYNKGQQIYHPFVWRGWKDYGTGALGDMGCHMMDGTYWVMDPGYPTSVEPIMVEEITKDAFPLEAIIKWTFPPRHGRPGFDQYWYESGLKPEKPAGVEGDWELPSNGSVWIGSKGVLLFHGSGGPIETFPKELYEDCGEIPQILPLCPNQDHYAEWLNAILGDDTAKSNFTYAGGLAEGVLLGSVAMQVGEKFEYDGARMVTTSAAANELIHKEYRAGWGFGLNVDLTEPDKKAADGAVSRGRPRMLRPWM